MEIKPSNYVTILAPMVTELHLEQNELLVFALIHGFSQNEQMKYTGNIQYISDWTSKDKSTVIRVLKSLVKKGYLSKEEKMYNNIKFCTYSSNYNKLIGEEKSGGILQPVVQNDEKIEGKIEKIELQNDNGGCKMQPNINNNITTINNELFNNKKNKQKVKPESNTILLTLENCITELKNTNAIKEYFYKQKKIPMYKYESLIDEFVFLKQDEYTTPLIDYINFRTHFKNWVLSILSRILKEVNNNNQEERPKAKFL